MNNVQKKLKAALADLEKELYRYFDEQIQEGRLPHSLRLEAVITIKNEYTEPAKAYPWSTEEPTPGWMYLTKARRLTVKEKRFGPEDLDEVPEEKTPGCGGRELPKPARKWRDIRGEKLSKEALKRVDERVELSKETIDSLQRGLRQARERKFVEGPDMETLFADQIEDDCNETEAVQEMMTRRHTALVNAGDIVVEHILKFEEGALDEALNGKLTPDHYDRLSGYPGVLSIDRVRVRAALAVSEAALALRLLMGERHAAIVQAEDRTVLVADREVPYSYFAARIAQETDISMKAAELLWSHIIETATEIALPGIVAERAEGKLRFVVASNG